ncbi:MAG: SoxR reducing system RseC family protein [Bacteroidota bacterium]
MNTVETTKEGDELSISLIQKRPSRVVLSMLLLATMVFLLIPIAILLFVGIGLGTMFGAFLFLVVFYYFFRMYLWNTRGKEIVKINRNQIVQIIDYGMFKEESTITNKDLSLKLYFEDSEPGTRQKEKILDANFSKYTIDGIVRFIRYKDVVLEINTKIPSSHLEQLEDDINAYLN